MAKGKAGEGKDGKKSSYVPVVVGKGNTGFVRVNLKLVNWTFDNQVVTLRVTSPLHSLARRVIEKHGHVRDLTLYKGQINPASIMADMDAALASLGFEGADSPEEAKPVNVSGAAREGAGWSWEFGTDRRRARRAGVLRLQERDRGHPSAAQDANHWHLDVAGEEQRSEKN
jgi:hypothetical protein